IAGVYSEQVLEEDLERVRVFYRKHGYQDVEVNGDVYRDASGRGLYVHLKVSEGLQHRVGQVAVEGTLLFPEREIRQVVTLKPGAVYSQDALQEDLRAIKEYYGDRGYIHAQVTPDPQLDPQTKRVRLMYHVTEKELVYVNRIDIRGNLTTKDEVVRRDLRIHPGERYDGAKIRKSVDRLYNLGYFEEVTVDTQPSGGEDSEDLIVQVKETKTGSFSFGGGFSSVDKLVGLIELEQRNFDWRNWPRFTGAGQDLRFRVEAGTVRRYFDVSFTEPWWFGRPLSFGIDAYNRTRLRSRDIGLAFEEERRGAGLRLGKELADIATVGVDYQLFRTEISDVVDEASTDLKAEQGRSTISVVGLNLAYDRRNNRFDPSSGAYAFLTTDVAGGPFAGDRDFYRVQSGASYYMPHGEENPLVLEARLRAGMVKPYGDSAEVPIFERFFGGGSTTIRGFEERKVGPRDPVSNDPIGGEAIFVATLEEVVTLARDDRSRPILRGAVFYDVGNVWRRTGEFADEFKSGAGVGVRVVTPIGPVRLDLGFPISDIAGEEKKPRLHFNISRTY
ncbi:MAG: outer membrane protein assembly factor BamA, partial [Dehalococcoidia bacterium]|nr:outer membrane protein assembly factor BamA [Dehalococcoidia bacterium]